MACGVVEANALVTVDPYRAAPHNKGVLNGIDPVVIATGNDWCSIEAGAHAYAARDGANRALTEWRVDEATGDLVGRLEVPMGAGHGGRRHAQPPAGRGMLQEYLFSPPRQPPPRRFAPPRPWKTPSSAEAEQCHSFSSNANVSGP